VATRNIENVSTTVETMMRTAHDSTRIATDYVVEAQELNTGFARRAFETWIDASRRQTELAQAVTQRLFGKAEEQADALRDLYGQWVGMPWTFPFSGTSYAPASFRRRGMRLVEAAVVGIPGGNGGLSIENYDELTVDEISDQLGYLSAEELEKVRDYERRNKNRETLIEQLDRKIQTNS
jgi:hypothetical protein